MGKILFNILTCNRFFYLRNYIESAIECLNMDRVDILVCDNNTIEPGFDEYMHKICSKYKNITMKKFTDRTKNELYRAMNWAVAYAKKNGYDIINFVQDDRQYLYRDDLQLDSVEEIFKKHKNIVQINGELAWRRKIKKIGKIKVLHAEHHDFGTLIDKRVCDNGFTRVAIYDEIGEYPMSAISWGMEKNRYVGKTNGEIWFGKKCYKHGYNRALIYAPNYGMIYDCAYVRGEDRYGDYFPPPNRFYFKLLEKEHIKKIRKRAKRHKFSFVEDFCIPDGWKPKTLDKHGDINIINKIG